MAAEAGYISVANIHNVGSEENMPDKINDGLAALALAMDESLNQDVDTNKANSPTPPASCDRFRSPAPSCALSPSTSTDTAILETLKAMQAYIIAMEKNRGVGGGGRGANRRDRIDHVIDPNATKCRHCNRVHIRPDSGCWDLEANAHRRPENWKKSKKE